MKKQALIALSLVVIGLVFFSCSKDELAGSNQKDLLIKQRSSKSIPDDPMTYSEVVLGEEVENPFSIKNLKDAASESCSDTFDFRVTDRLIKFTFKDANDFLEIQLDSSFILYPFPLNRKILEMGDMFDDGRASDELQDLYAIVDIKTIIPSKYDYEVLDEYDYKVKNIFILIESFRRTGNMDHLESFLKTLDVNDIDTVLCKPVQEIIILPREFCPDGCYYSLNVSTTATLIIIEYNCVCPPDPPEVTLCGCPGYYPANTLAGCVTVENNSLGAFIPVEDVEIIVQNKFSSTPWINWLYTSHRTRTDENGCWSINEKFSDEVWVWVRFLNSDSYERYGFISWPLSESLKPVKDFAGSFAEEDFKNINIAYSHWGTETDTELHRNWGAAAVNNQLKEYLRQTTDITSPPKLLDIVLQPNLTKGAAIMIGFGPGLVSAITPDLSLGIKFSTYNNLARLSYHEFGHASHFAQVGAGWWSVLFQQELSNSIQFDWETFSFSGEPYGNGSEPNAGHIALAESSADFIRDQIIGDDQETDLFEHTHIPVGLYHDLIDVNPPGVGFDLTNGIRDGVSGYTRAQLFGSLNSQVTNLSQYRQTLTGILPPGNTTTGLNLLITDYTK